MPLPAHTTARGTNERVGSILTFRRGKDWGGAPVSELYSTQYIKDHRTRLYGGGPPVFIPGTTIPMAKGYYDVIARVLYYEPMRWRESGYPWDPQRDIESSAPFPEFSAYSAYPPQADNLLNNLKNRSRTECLLKLRGGSNLELGVDLIESKKTLNMIAGRSIQVLEAYRAARRLQFGRIPGILGVPGRKIKTGSSPANIWLEYQYGWKPLMGTIYDGAKLLDQGFRKPQLYSCKSPNASEEFKFQGDRFNSTYNYAGNVRVKTGVTYKVASAKTDMFDAAGLLNPLSIAWELVPFSFVSDWFAPVGNVLAALSATAGLEFVDGYESTVWDITHSRTQHTLYPGDPYVKVLSYGLAVNQNFHFFRNQLLSFPKPGFYTSANPFSTAHVLNALALIRQLWR